MPSDPEAMLQKECVVFTKFLVGREPTEYMMRKYCEAHRRPPLANHSALTSTDAMLLQAAVGGLVSLRMADVFARFFCPGSLLRQKLVLMLAILENSPSVHEELDRVSIGSVPATLVRMSAHVAWTGLLLAGALVRFGPRHFARRTAAPAVQLRQVETI